MVEELFFNFKCPFIAPRVLRKFNFSLQTQEIPGSIEYSIVLCQHSDIFIVRWQQFLGRKELSGKMNIN